MHGPGRLRRALAQQVVRLPYSGSVFRAVLVTPLFNIHRLQSVPWNQQTPRHPLQPLYDLGAPQHGARFTPVNGTPTLYVAEEPEAAFLEVNWIWAQFRGQRNLGSPGPTVVMGAVVSLGSVLNLADPADQALLGTNSQELGCDWRVLQRRGRAVPTQRLGQAVYDSGRFQAIRYPSVRSPGHCCLAIFTNRVRAAPASPQAPSQFVQLIDLDDNLSQRIP